MNYREILIRLMSMTTPFVYDDEESFLEMLRKFYKYLNELTIATKDLSDEVEEVRNDMNSIEDEVNAKLDEINQILEQYDIKIERVANQIYTYVDNQIVNLREYVNAQDDLLDAKIQAIEAGAIKLYDPTTGLYSPIQIVIDNVYDMNRGNALTATEYDALDLTATDYDAYDITARQYDIEGKTLLV